MKEEEFNLSDKGQRFHLDYDFYCETDVKEFIKRLKENAHKWDRVFFFEFSDIIDKLSGEKLI